MSRTEQADEADLQGLEGGRPVDDLPLRLKVPVTAQEESSVVGPCDAADGCSMQIVVPQVLKGGSVPLQE